jgi:hypothetical protein
MPSGASLGDYLREAFRQRWNLLLFGGGLAAAIMSPWPDALLPLVAAGEIAYLAGLISIPKFREAVDARVHARRRSGSSTEATAEQPRVDALLARISPEARRRFEDIRRRCREMQRLADEVRGRSGHDSSEPSDELRTPALDRLLWVFLRLLVSQSALQRFLASTTERDIEARLKQVTGELETARTAGDERIIRSLQDSVAVSDLRLDNYRKAVANARFVTIELDRIEGKIHALTEMAVNRQDPNILSSQVDSVAESMRQTEQAMTELQHITGLADELAEPPPILDAELDEVQQR